jgi:hypothetical protein
MSKEAEVLKIPNESQKKYYKMKYNDENNNEFKKKELERWKQYNYNRYHTNEEFKRNVIQQMKDKYHNDPEYRAKRLAYKKEYTLRKKREKEEAQMALLNIGS